MAAEGSGFGFLFSFAAASKGSGDQEGEDGFEQGFHGGFLDQEMDNSILTRRGEPWREILLLQLKSLFSAAVAHHACCW